MCDSNLTVLELLIRVVGRKQLFQQVKKQANNYYITSKPSFRFPAAETLTHKKFCCERRLRSESIKSDCKSSAIGNICKGASAAATLKHYTHTLDILLTTLNRVLVAAAGKVFIIHGNHRRHTHTHSYTHTL